MKRLLVFLISILFSLNLFGNNGIEKSIIPTPQLIKVNEGIFSILDKVTIGISDKKLNFIATQIKRSLENSFGTEVDIDNSGDIILRIVKYLGSVKAKGELYNQAYQIIITENQIEINAVTPKGLYYGAMSLVQLIEHSVNKEILAVEIVDWPNMELRGISDDISRGQVSTLNNFKRIIDFIARYKMNVYMPYIEDMLQLKSYPSIGKGRGALSKKEVKEIVKYASERYVDVIPAFQTLGHFENILTSKKFVDYAEFPGAASLAITEKKTYKFLENMLKEVFAVFPSKYINIGADESYDVGSGKSKERTKKIGRSRIHAEHYKKVFNICKKNKRKIMMYGDVILNHRDILKEIPNDVIIVDWHYSASTRYPSTDILKNAGFKFLVSPSVWNFRTIFPAYQIALPNIKTIIHDGLLNNSVGVINSNWGDYGAETFKEFVLFGYAWSAQCSWNYEASNLAEFNNTFFFDFFGIDDFRLNSLYKTFSIPFNQMQWHDVFRHPALELSKGAWWAPRMNREEISSWINWTLPNVYNTIDEFQSIGTKNKKHFDLFRFLIQLDFWYIRKLKANYYIRSIIELNKLKENEKKNKNEINSIKHRLKEVSVVDIIDKNVAELKNLKENYEKLWLKYYKKDNLNMIMDKFNRLISYFEETKEAIENDILSTPTIASKWIYSPKRRQVAYKEAEFKREFTIKSEVQKAQLQLLADTHAKLYINGKFVNEIFSKRSLSLLTEYDRYLFIDAKKYFKKGKNKIRVVAKSYKGSKGTGINFIAKISTSNGTFEILSDKKWVSRKADKNGKWKKAITKEYKYYVIAPNFETKRTSWIER